MDVSEVKRALAARVEDVCRHLLPHGKKVSQEWCCGDITGKEGDSLRVNLSKEKSGVWSDFADNNSGSNLLELWIQVKNISFRDALEEAKKFIGVHDSAPIRSVAEKSYVKPKPTDISEVSDIIMMYLTQERNIMKEVIDLFQIKASPKDPCVIAFPYMSENGDMEMVKYLSIDRSSGKKKIWTTPSPKKGLFGKHLITGEDREIIICEGEIDAMTWTQLGYRALSVPFGAKWESKEGRDPNDEWIEHDFELLESMEKIYLSFDADEEGEKARDSIMKRLGRDRCFLIEMPTEVKDANEALVNGYIDELRESYAGATQRDPSMLKTIDFYHKGVENLFFSEDSPILNGIPMPFETRSGHFCWRWHEVTIFTGINGSGKTALLNWISIMWAANSGKKTMLASFEVVPEMTIRFLVSQVLGVDIPKDKDHLKKAMDWLSGYFWIFDREQEAWVNGKREQFSRDVLIETIIYAYRRYGIQFFVIDSLMKCGLGTEDYEGQKNFVNDLTDLVKQIPIHIVLVAHPKKGDSERSAPGKMDIKGTSEISDLVHNVFSVWRNKSKEDEIKKRLSDGVSSEMDIKKYDVGREDTQLNCSKQRNGNGEEPHYKIWYNKTSRQFADSYIENPLDLTTGNSVSTEDVETPILDLLDINNDEVEEPF